MDALIQKKNGQEMSKFFVAILKCSLGWAKGLLRFFGYTCRDLLLSAIDNMVSSRLRAKLTFLKMAGYIFKILV